MQKRIELVITKSVFGFTLIELIVVIGIISVMAAAALATLNPFAQFQKANDSKRKADLSQIQKALESYYQDNGTYPSQGAEYTITGATWGGNWGAYMNLVPKDSKLGYNYAYYVTTDLQSYYLYASLERGAKDSQACQNLNSNGECPNKPFSAINACGGGCNYGVSTPDKSP